MFLYDLLSSVQWSGFYVNLFGIPFFISFFVIVMVALFAFGARHYIAKQMGEYPDSNHMIIGIGVALTIILTICAHEGAHGAVGWILGHPTVGGGISWWGAYVSFGKSVNSFSPIDEIFIGFAGIFTNAVIAIIGLGLVWFMGESRFENAVQYVAIINWRLAKLNLIPILMLDGGKVVEGILRVFLPANRVPTFMLGVTALVIFIWSFTKKKGADEPDSAFQELIERV